MIEYVIGSTNSQNPSTSEIDPKTYMEFEKLVINHYIFK
jgi:hypothetical protein